MAQAPQVTITANMQDVFGAVVPNSKLRMQLAGYGSQVPRISGTGLICKTTPIPIDTPAGGLISEQIWGNYQITPAGTYYTFVFVDDNGNSVQLNAYQFLAAGNYDLSSAPLYDPPPPSVLAENPVLQDPPGQATQTIDGSIVIDGNLTVTGTINGGESNSPFIVASSAAPVFDGDDGSGFKITLGHNAAAVFQNMAGKLLVTVRIVQPASGPTFTFTWPSTVRNCGEIPQANGAISIQLLTVDSDGSLDSAAPMQFSFPA